MAANYGEVDFVHELPRVRSGSDESCDESLRMRHRVADCRAVDQVQSLRQADFAGPLAFTRRFTRRAAEHVEETQIDLTVGQLRGAEASRYSGDGRGAAGGNDDRIVELLRPQAPGDGVRVIDVVVLIPLVGFQTPLVGLGTDDRTDQVLEIKLVRYEIFRESGQQLAVG